ncbi:hypothetical protein [Clostridium coskatii]|nr:hypothetical protein [Clostridium coskatii]OAA90805.1 hypothetical protein WX73_01955 [Clostridium coskatii]
MSKSANEINRPFTALVATINSQIQMLNVAGYKLYDVENPEYYIEKVAYDPQDDELKFTCKED